MAISNKDQQILKQYLNSQRLMSVATYGDHPWIASVYYLVDDELNLYFISPPDAQHSKHIIKNYKVACSIADSSQKANQKLVGLQIYGKVSVISGLSKIKWMLNMYNKLHPSTKEKLNYKNYQAKIMTSKVYKIKPKKIKFFNQKLYSNPPEKVFKF